MHWQITDEYPSSILRDFHIFLEDLSSVPSPLTPSLNLARKTLFALNSRMSRPETGVTERTDQVMYPLLHLFYHLSLESGLFSLGAGERKPWFEPNLEKIGAFRAMEPEAQYFFLLETYLQHSDWESLDPNRNFGVQIQLIGAMPQLVLASPGEKIPIRKDSRGPIGFLSWNLGYHGLYFEYFGLWAATEMPIRKEWPKTWRKFESLALTRFGKFLFEMLNEKGLLPDPDEEEKMLDYFLSRDDRMVLLNLADRLHEYFQDSFPTGTFANMLPVVEEVEARKGVFVFKVSLRHDPKIWCRVALSSQDTLHALHRIIQQAYRFDDDHLYCFYLHPRSDRRDTYNHPWTDMPPFADEALIGELNLAPGRKFRYLFDFGDRWWFDIVLEEIREGEELPGGPKVLEKKGRAPRQYG
ncbi:MAG: plasmid pRiA4b ORF-3 family protein [Phaeodactylibacter sp.]|nr:plasmid pRiA4b ORF-3 family protein [Phaeodactylibacter sp.]MCB9053108.1 plasmid pRiA4b ORF-3 family protein [Lewinellaceae bacterium]